MKRLKKFLIYATVKTYSLAYRSKRRWHGCGFPPSRQMFSPLRITTTIVMMLLLSLVLMSCNSIDDDIHEITDHFFSHQILELHLNAEEFLGRTIRYQGIFRMVTLPNGEDIFLVYRYGDACCGSGMAGLEIYLRNATPFEDGTWVEVTGVLEEFDAGDETFKRLSVDTLFERESPSSYTQ